MLSISNRIENSRCTQSNKVTSPNKTKHAVLDKAVTKDSFYSKNKKIIVGAFSVAALLGLALVFRKGISQNLFRKANKVVNEQASEVVEKTSKEVGNTEKILSIAEKELDAIDFSKRSNLLDTEFNRRAVDIIEECQDLTYDTPNLKLIKDWYDEDCLYDLGTRFATVANNTARVKGNAIIVNKVPEIFSGVDKTKLLKTLDKLPSFLEKSDRIYASEKVTKFVIDNKVFTARFMGCGQYSHVYKIQDEFGNQICYKAFRTNRVNASYNHGAYAEIGLLQEAYKAGVTDVPQLYMANPIGKNLQNGNLEGAWQVTEFIEKGQKAPADGLKFLDWLRSKHLVHNDLSTANQIDGFIVDIGGISESRLGVPRELYGSEVFRSGGDITNIFIAQQQGKPLKEILKEIKTV